MEDGLYLQLHKLWPLVSEEAVESMIQTLWETRKTGLADVQKTHIRSLINLPSWEELQPVLSCLRSIIRRCVREKLAGNEIRKLFPLDLDARLQEVLLLQLQKHQSHWMEEASRDQLSLQKISLSYKDNSGTKASVISAPTELLTQMWPREDNSNLVSSISDDERLTKISCMSQMVRQPSRNLPWFKSLSWTLENQKAATFDRVAVITLKLQDLNKALPGETEVKFRISRDTLETLFQTMTYISSLLSKITDLKIGLIKAALDLF